MRKVTVLSFVLVMLLVSVVFAQHDPVPIVTPVLVDSAVYNGVYRGVQSQFYCEPSTGYLVAAWYRYYSEGPDPRRITAATSIDGGQTWTVHPSINFGVGAEMNARYATVCGTPTTPIVAYSDRNPGGSDRDSRPVVATDIAGWGSGAFVNWMVDDTGTPDTVLYGRYLSCSVAPDNPNLIAVGCYHNAEPGEALYYYYSQDGGATWSRPKVVASAVDGDSSTDIYVPDLSSSGLGVKLGPNNTVMISGLCQWLTDDDDVWRILYATSDDMGNTFSPVAVIPGSENVSFGNSDFYRQFTQPLIDGAGNWHIFGVGVDTTEYDFASTSFPEPYRAFDFKFDGSTWTINKFAFPHLLENGIVAWGDWPSDTETYSMNEPAVGPDGTLYYAYSDVVDTTDAMGDEANFNYNIMVMYSDDNGDTWHGPVSVLDQWTGHAPNGMAPYATDKLHIVYRRHFNTDQTDLFYYLGVPTDTIKARATAVGETFEPIMPAEFTLHQNYPNPFNPTTSITFDLTERAHVTLKVFNEMGQEVATVIDKPMNAGFKGVTWNAANLPSGVYFYQLTAGDMSQTKRMVLMK